MPTLPDPPSPRDDAESGVQGACPNQSHRPRPPDVYHTAVAFGAANRPATFQEKRDGVDEYVEGEADRLEYDGKTDTVRFVNHASVRRLRGGSVADEITGNLVTYDGISEVFSV